MKCTDIIIQDHIQIRRALGVVDGMLKKLENGQRIEILDARTILKFLRQFADEYHQVSEDTLLFPALLQAAPGDSALQHFVSDHCGERSLVDEIEEALLSRRGMAFFRGATELTSLLRIHCEREESIVCNLAERCLSKDQDDQIAATFLSRRAQADSDLNFARLERIYPLKPLAQPIRVFQSSVSTGESTYR